VKTISCADIAALRTIPAGALVALEGTLITLRDGALARMVEEKKRGEAMPVVLEGRIVFFAGPTPGIERGRGAIGPTTSRRMVPYFPLLADCGIAAIIGKGSLDEDSSVFLRRVGICYVQAIGGAGAFYGSRVTHVKIIGYEGLGPEAIYELTVRDFIVMMSSDGISDWRP